MSLDHLPIDILSLITRNLLPRDVFASRLVCKAWHIQFQDITTLYRCRYGELQYFPKLRELAYFEVTSLTVLERLQRLSLKVYEVNIDIYEWLNVVKIGTIANLRYSLMVSKGCAITYYKKDEMHVIEMLKPIPRRYYDLAARWRKYDMSTETYIPRMEPFHLITTTIALQGTDIDLMPLKRLTVDGIDVAPNNKLTKKSDCFNMKELATSAVGNDRFRLVGKSHNNLVLGVTPASFFSPDFDG